MTNATDEVVLCDVDGRPTGMVDKLRAHADPGMLHQAFSVFVFRNAGQEVLIQQRSREKLLFASRWANTCCSHPRGESQNLVEAATDRLHDEFGFTVPLTAVGSFVYRASDRGKGVEHEYDTVLVGHAIGAIELHPNPGEIDSWKWIDVGELTSDIGQRSEVYAPWLQPALQIACESL